MCIYIFTHINSSREYQKLIGADSTNKTKENSRQPAKSTLDGGGVTKCSELTFSRTDLAEVTGVCDFWPMGVGKPDFIENAEDGVTDIGTGAECCWVVSVR